MAMIDFELLEAVEGDVDLDPFEYYSVLQVAINNGVAWRLQGGYGRELMAAINNGYCMLGKNAYADYYGNVIPARDDVKPGTKGSWEYVANAQGEMWANTIDG
jgi:hypothetical protein